MVLHGRTSRDRRSDSRLLSCLGDLGRRAALPVRRSPCCRLLGQHQAVGLAVICGCARHHPGRRRLRARASLSVWGRSRSASPRSPMTRGSLIADPEAAGSLQLAAVDPHRVRRCRTADDREFLAQYRSRSGGGTSGRCASRSAGCLPTSCSCSPMRSSLAAASTPVSPWAAPIVAAFMAPLLALAMARNREWRVDIHVSRQVVLHTATLVASGCFLVAVAIVAMLLRGFGGDWGLVLQLAMLFGSIVVLATVLSSGSVRRRLKYLDLAQLFYASLRLSCRMAEVHRTRLRTKRRRGAFGQDHPRCWPSSSTARPGCCGH